MTVEKRIASGVRAPGWKTLARVYVEIGSSPKEPVASKWP